MTVDLDYLEDIQHLVDVYPEVKMTITPRIIIVNLKKCDSETRQLLCEIYPLLEFREYVSK